MALFSEKSLKLMPSNALTSLSNSMIVDAGQKQSDIASLNSKIGKLQGVSTVKLPVGGRANVLQQGGDPAAKKIQESMTAAPLSFATGANVMNDTTNNPSGVPAFVPGTTDFEPTPEDVSEMTSQVSNFLEGNEPPKPSPLTASKIQSAELERAQIQDEINQIEETQNMISDILGKRASGDLPNPKLNLDALNMNLISPNARKSVVDAVQLNEE